MSNYVFKNNKSFSETSRSTQYLELEILFHLILRILFKIINLFHSLIKDIHAILRRVTILD